MKHRSLIRLGNGALAFGLITSTVAGALLLVTTPAAAANVATSSATTISWVANHPDTSDPNYQEFKNLTVSVSQTKNLVNQGVTVDWAGAVPTSTGNYATDYMQIMQCWGDDAAGPDPEQCQWGATSSAIAGIMGADAAGRNLSVGSDPAQDPALTGPDADPNLLIDPPIESPNQRAYRVPFMSIDGTISKSTTQISKIFDANTTNEISAARTGADGTGEATIETQTALEAPAMGCGGDTTAADGSITPRACWLVVVPRGKTNLNGGLNTDNTSGMISGSPLSASAWKERIVIPLEFQSVSQSCPLGNPEQRIVGSEMIAEAVTSWQPSLCTTGTTYGYSLIGDSEARNQIVSGIDGAAHLAVVANPLNPDVTTGATIDYAPVAANAIVVAFNIDYRLTSTASNISQDGLQVQNVTLSPRLVAKMLTQSYRSDVPGEGQADTVIQHNPVSVLTDPEFVALNPAFAGFTSDSSPQSIMVALGSSDANAMVWAWLRSDPLAQAFLEGEPDENGMTINPSYLALNLGTDTSIDSFPKADLTVVKGSADADEPGYGTLDMEPYTIDMNEAAYRTLRADNGAKTSWNTFGQPKNYISLGAQLQGQRFVFSLTDAADAARYGLNTAKLVNGAGQAIAPTTASIQKGVATMPDSTVAGVKVADPSKRAVGAYPLAMLSYAAVNVCASTDEELTDYAKLITYAVGKGQVSGDALGQLPEGYVPLDSSLVNQATSTAATLSDLATIDTTCRPVAPATSTPKPTSKPTATKTPTPVATVPAVVPAPPVPTSVATTPAVVPTQDPEDTAEVQHTKDAPLSPGRAGLAGALALGLPSMIVGPLLSRRGRKLAKLSELE